VNGEALLALCKESLAAAGEADAEIWVRARRRGYARFSVSELSQHMHLEEAVAHVRVASGRRVAEVTGTALDRDALVQGIARAAELARGAPEQDGFSGFAGAGEPTPQVVRFAEATASVTDAERAAIVAHAIDATHAANLVAAGILETSVESVAVATTAGCARAHDGTRAELRAWALEDAAGRGASGHASHLVRDVRDLDVERVTNEAIRAAQDGTNPGSVDAGTWDVVMEATAVAELLEWLSAITFSAPEVEQGTSALAEGLDRALTGDRVLLAEDPLAEDGLVEPFDREGTIRGRVTLLERGVGRAILTDRAHAARARSQSTGNAVPVGFGAPEGVGAIALDLAGGDAPSAADLVTGLDRGLYIRRLHYVNGFLDPKRAMMTGLSRDGCFLVEHGKIVRAVGNVRLTDSFFEMLARADAMTSAREAFQMSWIDGGTMKTPAIRFRGVRFTSGSNRVTRRVT
jgi:predicted Zn-dependent protease